MCPFLTQAMSTMDCITILIIMISVLMILVSEWHKKPWIEYVFKPIASFGFVWLAMGENLLNEQKLVQNDFEYNLLLALILSVVGDLFLLSKKDKIFTLGLFSFLVAHLFYFIAVYNGVSALDHLALYQNLKINLQLTMLVVYPLCLSVLYFILPYIPKDLKIPSLLYVCVIALMFSSCVAYSLTIHQNQHMLLIGSFLFVVSDWFVAQERYRNGGFWSRFFGLPLYYIAQIVFALHFQYIPH